MRRQKGFILITTFIIVIVIGILIISLTSYFIYDQNLLRKQALQNQAMYLALSGITYYQNNTGSFILDMPVTIAIPESSTSNFCVITKRSAVNIEISGIIGAGNASVKIYEYKIRWDGTRWTKI